MGAMRDAYGLVVGIAAYRRVRPLPATVVNDASDVHALLVDPNRGGYSPDRVQLITDAQATRPALVDAMGALAARAGEDSVVFVYLSGHGARLDSGQGSEQYLLPVDAAAGTRGELAHSAISGTQFSQLLRAIAARKVVVMFDCCHAGGVGAPKASLGPVLEPGISEGYYETLRSGRGRAIIASSRSDEYSFVLPGAHNSLFTHHLLAGMRGGVVSDDGTVRIFDLFEYVQPRVTADEPRQHPVFRADLEDNFPVALYRGGERVAVPLREGGFRYDAYISYVDREPDASWVWDRLLPRLEGAGLKIAISGDVEQAGVARVVGIERGIRHSRRIVVVLSPAYLADGMADFENVLAQTVGVMEGTYRLLPVKIANLASTRLPARLKMLAYLDLTHPTRAEHEMRRLIQALHGPLPTRLNG
jgi:hypothetical protein